MPSVPKPKIPAPPKKAVWERYLFTGIFIIVYATVLLQSWHVINLPSQGGLDASLLVLAAAGTLVALSRHLPWQNILLASFIIALAAGAVTSLNLATGIPFGQFVPSEKFGPILHKIFPITMPLLWIVVILNSRGVARLILRPWRKTHAYGFRLIGLAAVLTMLFDLALDPFANKVKHFWYWEPVKLPLTWQNAPVVNFLGWLVVAVVILAFITPVLINKSPAPRQPPDLHPLGMWLGGILLFINGLALAGLWPAVALNVIIALAVPIFAIRGALW